MQRSPVELAMDRLTPLEIRLTQLLARVHDGLFGFGVTPKRDEIEAILNSDPGIAEIFRTTAGGTAHGGIACRTEDAARSV